MNVRIHVVILSVHTYLCLNRLCVCVCVCVRVCVRVCVNAMEPFISIPHTLIGCALNTII